MNVLVLPKYGPKAASVRYRFLQYQRYLEQAGVACTISPLLNEDYLTYKFETGRAPRGPVVRAFIKRTLEMLAAHQFDLVVLHCEALPYLPPVLERFLQ